MKPKSDALNLRAEASSRLQFEGDEKHFTQAASMFSEGMVCSPSPFLRSKKRLNSLFDGFCLSDYLQNQAPTSGA